MVAALKLFATTWAEAANMFDIHLLILLGRERSFLYTVYVHGRFADSVADNSISLFISFHWNFIIYILLMSNKPKLTNFRFCITTWLTA